MNKKVKTTLIVALSLFGAGVIIFLCAAMSVNFNFAKLSTGFQIGGNSGADVVTEHIEKGIKATGQDIALYLSSADVTITPSADDMIHLSYDNSENCYFTLEDSASNLTFKQAQASSFFYGFMFFQEPRVEVTLSIPVGHKGTLNINGASSDISITDLDMSGSFDINSVSGEISIVKCKTETLETGSTSGGIELSSVETDSILAQTVSGEVRISEISKSIPIKLESTSGEVYAEKVKTSNMEINTISGEIILSRVEGQKVTLSTTSGGTELDGADFREMTFTSVSGDIRGTVSGTSDDYTVYTSTVSGSDSLSAHKGRGARTLDLSSTSGNFDISFEK